MNQASYNIVMANLNQSVEAGISSEIAANKTAVVGLFPGFGLIVSTLLWKGLLKIGSIIGNAIVGVVLKKLGQMTLAEVAGLLTTFMASQGKQAHPSIVACSQGRVAVMEPPTPPIQLRIHADDDDTI